MHLLDESLEYIVYNLPEKLMEIFFFQSLYQTREDFIRYSYFIVHLSCNNLRENFQNTKNFQFFPTSPYIQAYPAI